MKSSLSKEILRGELPICIDPLIVRVLTRQDLDRLAAWPKYPFPYAGFEFSLVSLNAAKRDRLFDEKDGKSNGLSLIIDHKNQPAIGSISLARIDWSKRRIGNFGFRIHPEWVDKGIGTHALGAVSSWSFDCGVSSIGVNVAASNMRAVRCYEKVGFYIVEEIWRPAEDLKEVDFADTRYEFLRPHLRQDEDVPELRFFFMELKPDNLSTPNRDTLA